MRDLEVEPAAMGFSIFVVAMLLFFSQWGCYVMGRDDEREAQKYYQQQQPEPD